MDNNQCFLCKNKKESKRYPYCISCDWDMGEQHFYYLTEDEDGRPWADEDSSEINILSLMEKIAKRMLEIEKRLDHLENNNDI